MSTPGAALDAPAAPRPDVPGAEVDVRAVEALVIGAGQAGLSAAYFLAQRGFAPHDEAVVLDANPAPGGAWQHRWPTLKLDGVHGIHPLPGMRLDAVDVREPASQVVGGYFARYERRFALPIVRPVEVRSVHDRDDGRLEVVSDAGTWVTRALLNATGTWTRPFWPTVAGQGTFAGEQLHTADYPGPAPFRGRHVVVVGGGHSAVQHLAELAEVTTTTWVTRRPPLWREEPFDEDVGRRAVARVEEAVAAGRRPDSVVSVTGLYLGPRERAAAARGVYERSPMFDRVVPDGVVWDEAGADGGGRHVRADVILWATGFRHALDHLAPLQLRDRRGGIRMVGTRTARDPRVHLLGYGPSASTIGANRAGRVAVREVRELLGR